MVNLARNRVVNIFRIYSDMDRMLTKKVEELTLYLIEKDKQLKTQQQEIDELKKEVSTLTKPKK